MYSYALENAILDDLLAEYDKEHPLEQTFDEALTDEDRAFLYEVGAIA